MTLHAQTGNSGAQPRLCSAREGRLTSGASVQAPEAGSQLAPSDRWMATEQAIGEQRQLARAILIFIYVAWFALLVAGCTAYAGEPIMVKSRDLPLHWFDVVFRRAGGALLPGLWALRTALSLALPGFVDPRVNRMWTPGVLYGAQAGMRAVLYKLHYAGYLFPPGLSYCDTSADSQDCHPPHIMSDHILLAASLIGGLACEAVLPLRNWHHWRRREGSNHSIRRMLGAMQVLAAAALALLVSCESYFTARYFHPPGEILYAAVLGLVVFQVPLLLYAQLALNEQQAEVAAHAQTLALDGGGTGGGQEGEGRKEL